MMPVDQPVKTETIYVYPPTSLTKDCPVPVYKGTKWKDVADYAVQLQGRLKQCNADKAAIRKLVKQQG